MDTAEQELKAGFDLWQRALTDLAARAEGAVPAGNPFAEWADFSATDRHWAEVKPFMDAIVGSLGDEDSAGANVLADLGLALVHRFRAALWWLVTAGSDESISESVKLRAAREIPSFVAKGGFTWLTGTGAKKAVMAAIASKGDAVVGPLLVVWLKAAWAGAHKGAWSNSEQSGPPALQLFKPLYGILSHPQFFTGEGITSTRFDITAESLVAAENVGYPGAVLDAIAVFRMGVDWAMESARAAAAPESADEVEAYRILTAGFTSSMALSPKSAKEILGAAEFLVSSWKRRHGAPPDWSRLIDCAEHFKTRVDSLWADWRRIDKNSHDTGYVRAITGPIDDAVSSRKLEGRGHPWEWANAFLSLMNRMEEKSAAEFDFNGARGEMHSVRYREMEIGSEWLCHKSPRTVGGSGDYEPGTVYVYLGYDSSDDLCLMSKEKYESQLRYSPRGVTRGRADVTPAAFQEAFIEATPAAEAWWAKKAGEPTAPPGVRAEPASTSESRTKPASRGNPNAESTSSATALSPASVSRQVDAPTSQPPSSQSRTDTRWAWLLLMLALLCVPILINVLTESNSQPVPPPASSIAQPPPLPRQVPSEIDSGQTSAPARAESVFFRDSSRQWNFRTAVCRRSDQGRIMPADNGANYRMEWNPSNPSPLRITRQRENRDAREDRAPQVIAATPSAALVRAALCDQWPCPEPDIIIYLFLQRVGGAQVNGFFVTAKGPMRPLWGSVSDSDTSCDALNDLSPHLTCSLRRLLDLPFSRIQRGMEHDAETGRFATEAFAQCGQ